MASIWLEVKATSQIGIFLGNFSSHKKSFADKGKFIKYKIASLFKASSGITYLKKKHPKSNIEFFEISRLDDPIPYSKAIIGEFETNKFKGFDTIIILLRKLGYKKLSIIVGIPVLKQFFSILYYIFAQLIRPLLPKREV